MKVADGLKIIEQGWINKPKGYRVRFDQQTETGIETIYSPPQEDTPLKSDVTAWRYAWKLWQAALGAVDPDMPGAMSNITVVDDQDNLALFYATGKTEIYNPRQDSLREGQPIKASSDN